MSDVIYDKVTPFIIKYVYNNKKSSTLADSRSTMVRKMKKKSTRRLQPDEGTLHLGTGDF